MKFARPDLLPLVLLLPLLVAILVTATARRRRRVAGLLGEPATIARLGGAGLLRFPPVRLLLLVVAAAAVALAATGPSWGRRVVQGESEALNLVLALDVSKSMLARDIAPSRLERERLLVRRLLRELGGDRFGLVAFAGRAYVLSPVTIDHSAIELYLDALDPGIVSQGGSSLQSALLQATDLARGVEGGAGDRVVVLVSDGEALEDEDGILQAARRAASAGVRVFTVGVATTAGAPVPEVDPGTGAVVGYKHDETGAQVQSRLGEGLLRRIADRTDGEYLHILDGDVVARLASELGRLERGALGNEQRTEPVERFPLFLLMALLLVAADTMLFRGRSRRSGLPRNGQVAGAMLVMLLLSGFGIGDLERGNRLYRAGHYAEAAAAYREALGAHGTSPALHYNLATALLQLGRFDEAEREFRLALSTVDPGLRQRTLYNLGNRFLLEGRRGGEGQAARLQAAIAAYQQALRIEPRDARAKWNLELALREREQQQKRQEQQSQQEQSAEQPQQGGGGGGAQQQASGEQGQAGNAQQQRPMSESQADRILSAAEQDERDLAREKLRQGQRRTTVVRDW